MLKAGERGILRGVCVGRDVGEVSSGVGSGPSSGIGNSRRRKVPLPTSLEVAFGMTIMDYYFLRVTVAGGNGRRMGTIAPREGSVAACARENTSS